jgi:hypothetical protein
MEYALGIDARSLNELAQPLARNPFRWAHADRNCSPSAFIARLVNPEATIRWRLRIPLAGMGRLVHVSLLSRSHRQLMMFLSKTQMALSMWQGL